MNNKNYEIKPGGIVSGSKEGMPHDNSDIVGGINERNSVMDENRRKLFSFLVVPGLMCITFHAFYMISNAYFARILWIPGFLLSFALFWGIYMVIHGITNSSYKTVFVLSIILVVFGVGNQLKIAYSDDPIFLSDIFFLQSAGTFTDILKDTIIDMLTKYLILIVLMSVAFFYIYRLAKKTDYVSGDIRRRVLSVVMPIVLMIFISLPIKPVTDSMLTVFFNIKGRQDSYSTTNMGYYFKYGVFSGLFGQMLESRLNEPEGYSLEEMNDIIEKNKDNTYHDKDFGKPNIVMIFSESFWNIDDCEDIKFTEKVAPNFNELKNEGILIDMISPSYGGISANVEYEMLTGSSIKFFSAGYIPYMQLVTEDKYFNAPSIIDELRNNGYTTHISSTWESSLFNCEKVYEYMKVDKVDYMDDMKDAYQKGGRISDKYVGERIIEELKNKPKDEKLFTMTLTAQAHMPFKSDKYSSYDFEVKNSNLSKEEEKTLLSYAQGVRDADSQLRAVYDYIQTMDEPTILIFYGDHLPYLKTEDGDDATKNMKYFNSGDELTDLYNRYHTQCLILSNYEIGRDDINFMGPDLVMTYLINNMNLEVSPYYKWLYTTIDTLPASNLYISVDKNGNKYFTDKLDGEMEDVFELRNKMNWKYFVQVE